MGLELSEAVNKEEKKRKRERLGERDRGLTHPSRLWEKRDLCKWVLIFLSLPAGRAWVLAWVHGWCLRLNAGVRGRCVVCVLG